jgi:uncharacterized protein (DUF1800 family)
MPRRILAKLAACTKFVTGESQMTLSRRDFNAASLALLLANFSSVCFAASKSAPSANLKALSRLTFGATQASSAEFNELGLEAWLDRELAKPASNEDLQRRLAAARLMIEYEAGMDDSKHGWSARKEVIPYQYLEASGESLLPLLDFDKNGIAYEERIRPAREVQAASLIRAVHADAQLREVMTQFWHDHFNVNSMRDEHTAAYFGHYDKMMRDNAFGNFCALLAGMAKSPSMLYYLNNEASRASPANENFARELFELHTLGAVNYFNDKTTSWSDVPGAKDGLAQGYIDQDVYEAARALTGWSFGDGRDLGNGDFAPANGEFHYIDRWHDPYQKRILGVEFRANAGPMQDGEALLDLLAAHPATAKFVCGKICRRLGLENPSAELVDLAAKTWLDNVKADDQIAKIIRTIVLSNEFTDTEPRKLKRPFEYLASFYRAVGAQIVSPNLEFVWVLSKAGWNQHEFRPPTGHPDHSEHWANTNLVSGFVNIALNALEDWNGAAKADLFAALPEGQANIASGIRYWAARIQGAEPPDEAVSAILAQLSDDPYAPLPDDPGEREHMLRGIAAAAALSPQFLFR